MTHFDPSITSGARQISGARFRVAADPFGQFGRRVTLALLVRGTRPVAVCPAGGSVQPQQSGDRLVIGTGTAPPLVLTDSLAALEAVARLHPAQDLHPADPAARAREQRLMTCAVGLDALLDRVTQARMSNDLDIAVYFLRDILIRMETEVPVHMAALTNADLALFPVMERLQLLDHRHACHLLAGLPALCARHDHMARQLSPLEPVPDHAEAWLDGLARDGALLVGPRPWHEGWMGSADSTGRLAPGGTTARRSLTSSCGCPGGAEVLAWPG